MADATDLKSVGLNRPCRFESGHRQFATGCKLARQVIMKIISAIDDFNLRRRATSASLLLVSLFLLASTLLIKAVEPGPEADGIYSCGKEVKGKYVELGKLEIKGKTYATYSEEDKV